MEYRQAPEYKASRNCVDGSLLDEDWVVPEPVKVAVQWSEESKGADAVEAGALVVGVGLAGECLQATYELGEAVGAVEVGESRHNVYRLGSEPATALFVAVTAAPKTEVAVPLAKALLGAIKSKQVVVLDLVESSQVAVYGLGSEDENSLYYVASEEFDAKAIPGVPTLPPPFLLSGLSAAIITRAQVHARPACALVAKEPARLSSTDLLPFTKGLGLLAADEPCAALGGFLAPEERAERVAQLVKRVNGRRGGGGLLYL